MSDDLSAYQDLMTALATRREHRSAARDDLLVRLALDKHAHELAEKQRAALEADPGLLEPALIDLIDPEVLNSGEAGAVQRP